MPTRIENGGAVYSSPLRRLLTMSRRALLGEDLADAGASTYPHVELNYWQPNGWVNFGDELSRTIVALILATTGRTLQDQTSRPRQLLAIGSIMHYARPGATVWGTGINGDRPLWRAGLLNLDVRAVRGPLTRQLLIESGIDAPAIYGDPALLLPGLLGGRFDGVTKKGTVYIPHLSQTTPSDLPTGLSVVDPRAGWNKVVRAICEAEFVLSSSLHGLIVADAFGIPSRHVAVPNMSPFKFEDYYLGTGRSAFRSARSVNEAVAIGPEQPPHFDPSPLRAAFPFDLWE